MKELIFNHGAEQLGYVANMWFKSKRLPYLITNYPSKLNYPFENNKQ